MEHPITTRHSTMVRELGKSGADIAASMTDHNAHLLHMAVGVVGEVIELFAATDNDNFIEECGDIEFYLVGYLQGIGVAYEDLPPIDATCYLNDPEKIELEWLLIEAGNLLDLTKKMVVYNKLIERDGLLSSLSAVASLLQIQYESMETTREAVLAANLWKLREGPNARYKTGYSDKAAQERVDKQAGN